MKGVVSQIRNALQRRGLRRKRGKLSNGLRTLPADATLELESGVAIGQGTFGFRQLQVGALSYLRRGCELLDISRIGCFSSIGNGVVLGQDRPLDELRRLPLDDSETFLAALGSRRPAGTRYACVAVSRRGWKSLGMESLPS